MQYKIVMLYGQTPLRTVRTLARADDVAAMLAAKNLLERATRCVAVEVWDGERRIGKLYRPTDAARSRYPGAA
jgi:hypothetical protein